MPLKQGDITIGICVLIFLYITYKLIMLCCNCNELGPNSMLSSDYSFIDHFIPSNVSGQQLRTSDGNFSLIMQNDGNLVLYNNVVIGPYTAANTVIWQSNSVPENTQSPYRLLMKTNGELVIKDKQDTVIWTTGVPPGTISRPICQINVTSTNVAYVSIVDLGNSSKVLWVSDCTQLTKGPFTSNCVQKWWKDDLIINNNTISNSGCTVDLTANNNTLLNTYMSSTDDVSIMKDKMNMYKSPTTNEANTQICHGKSIFDKYNMTTLTSSQQLSSTIPKQYIPQNYAIPAGTAESTTLTSPTKDTLTNCMYMCNNDPTCTGFVRPKSDLGLGSENCWFKTANTSSNVVTNDTANQTWQKF